MARGEARFVGKTNLHELAYGISGINAAFGTPVNPLDPRRIPGGSSSGSAAAVAADEADVAYGTDTGGSIRIPAACCGIAGLKTTWGRISLDGVHPLAPSLDTVGPMARDVGRADRGHGAARARVRGRGRRAAGRRPAGDRRRPGDQRRGRPRAARRPGSPSSRSRSRSSARSSRRRWRCLTRRPGRPTRSWSRPRPTGSARDVLRPAPAGVHDHRRAAERRPGGDRALEGHPRPALEPGRAAGRAHPARVPAADRRRGRDRRDPRADLAGERGRAARAGAAGAGRAGRAPRAARCPRASSSSGPAAARTGCWRRAPCSSGRSRPAGNAETPGQRGRRGRGSEADELISYAETRSQTKIRVSPGLITPDAPRSP